MRLKREIKAEDVVGFVGFGLIATGVLLLLFAGIASKRSSNHFPGGPLRPVRLQTSSSE